MTINFKQIRNQTKKKIPVVVDCTHGVGGKRELLKWLKPLRYALEREFSDITKFEKHLINGANISSSSRRKIKNRFIFWDSDWSLGFGSWGFKRDENLRLARRNRINGFWKFGRPTAQASNFFYFDLLQFLIIWSFFLVNILIIWSVMERVDIPHFAFRVRSPNRVTPN